MKKPILVSLVLFNHRLKAAVAATPPQAIHRSAIVTCLLYVLYYSWLCTCVCASAVGAASQYSGTGAAAGSSIRRPTQRQSDRRHLYDRAGAAAASRHVAMKMRSLES